MSFPEFCGIGMIACFLQRSRYSDFANAEIGTRRFFTLWLPFVRAVVISRSLGIEQAVDLHIDAGAATSILLDKDIRRLGVDVEKLKVAERSLVGIGGQVRTYVIDDATLVFRAENGEGIIEKLRLFVGVHDLDRLPPEQREIMLRLP